MEHPLKHTHTIHITFPA